MYLGPFNLFWKKCSYMITVCLCAGDILLPLLLQKVLQLFRLLQIQGISVLVLLLGVLLHLLEKSGLVFPVCSSSRRHPSRCFRLLQNCAPMRHKIIRMSFLRLLLPDYYGRDYMHQFLNLLPLDMFFQMLTDSLVEPLPVGLTITQQQKLCTKLLPCSSVGSDSQFRLQLIFFFLGSYCYLVLFNPIAARRASFSVPI